MRKIVAIFGTIGIVLSQQLFAESKVKQSSLTQSAYYEVGPRKNYRTNLARQYFGGSSKCRNWKRFCGR